MRKIESGILAAALVVAACSDSHGPDRGSAAGRAGAGSPGSAGEGGPIELAPCEPGSLCWVHGAPIHALHGVDKTVFAVGAGGTLLQWTPDGFVHRESPAGGTDLSAVWVGSADDVWITTVDSRVFRSDRDGWTELDVKGTALTGSAPDDVWIGTQQYDGTNFIDRKPALYLTSLLVLARDDALALGLPADSSGMVMGDTTIALHFDGAEWRPMGGPFGRNWAGYALQRVGGEVWAVAADDAFRFDGSNWVAAQVPGGGEGMLYDGVDGFMPVPAEMGCTRALRIDGEAWCFGASGQLAHAAGERWARAPHDRFGATLPAVEWGRVAPAVWAGDARLAWGASASEVVRVRTPVGASDVDRERELLERYDGKRWSEIARGDFVDLAGSAIDDVWAVDRRRVLRYDGKTAREIALPAELQGLSISAVHSFGPHATWFIATNGARDRSLLLRHDDGEWTTVLDLTRNTIDGIELRDLAGSDERNLWVLGVVNPNSRVPVRSVLFACDGARCTQSPLWRGPDFRSFAASGDRLWLPTHNQLIALRRDELATLDLEMPPPRFDLDALATSRLAPEEAQLWVGPSDVWITTQDQAMRAPF